MQECSNKIYIVIRMKMESKWSKRSANENDINKIFINLFRQKPL